MSGAIAYIAIAGGYLLFCALMIFPLRRIFERAGMPAWYSIAFVIPGAGPLIVLFLLAFLDWPALTNRQKR